MATVVSEVVGVERTPPCGSGCCHGGVEIGGVIDREDRARWPGEGTLKQRGGGIERTGTDRVHLHLGGKTEYYLFIEATRKARRGLALGQAQSSQQ